MSTSHSPTLADVLSRRRRCHAGSSSSTSDEIAAGSGRAVAAAQQAQQVCARIPFTVVVRFAAEKRGKACCGGGITGIIPSGGGCR